MRVAYLLPDPGIPVGGVKGASVHVAEVCRALVAAGAEVRLFAMRAVGDVPPGVGLEAFDCPPLPRGAEGDAARLAAVQGFLAWAEMEMAAFHPDLVYERLSLFAGTGGALAERLGARRVVEVNAPVAAERARHAGLALVAVAEAATRDALAGANVIAVSETMARWSRERGAASVHTVPNGVDAERFEPRRNVGAAAAIRSAQGLERSEVVGFVGSMKPWHGVGTLLEAVAVLAPQRPGLRVLVVGDGPDLARLRDRAERPDLAGRCRFVGSVPSAEIPGYLAALDVAVAPYLHPGVEGEFYFSPLKVVEAMAAARPVVASRFEPVEAMLGGTGRLVPAGDAGRLAEALDGLLRDPSSARAAGAAARARATTEFDWRGVAARILALGDGTVDGMAGGSPVGRGR